MTDILDTDARREAERDEKQRASLAQKQFRKDVQEMLLAPGARRVLFAFLQTAGIDRSTFRESPQAMGHAAGWQDAGGWWLDLIRSHCPEREPQMRQEAREDAKRETQDDE